MRGTLSILILAAVVAVGLWYWRGQSDAPVDTRPETAEPVGDATAAIDSRTSDSGAATPTAGARPADVGATGSPSQAGARPADVGATGSPSQAGTRPADTGATGSPSQAGARPADVGATGSPSQAGARPADSGATGSPSQAGARPADSGTTGSSSQVAAAESVDDHPTPRSPAPEGVVEQMETATRERPATEPEVDAGAQGDATQAGAGRDQGAETADASAAPRAEGVRTAGPDEAEAEAKQYVEILTAATPRTIPVDKADHFVTGEHVVSLVPEDMIESFTVGALAEDGTLEGETPITVVREVEQIETAVPEQLIAESGGDLDTKLHVLVTHDNAEGEAGQADGGQGLATQGNVEENAEENAAGQDAVEQITVREVLERLLSEPEKPIPIVRTVRYFEVMTLRELLDTEEDTGTLLNVVKRPYRIEAATLADLLQREMPGSSDTIFYLHTVQPTDEQGIWGIVQSGLTDNFARGMAVRRGEKIETYTVRIPRDADERLRDQSSSFLGKLIDRKTEESFVYNYRENRMGRNPDRVRPGQEIVIINFEPEELVSIYKHFAGG